ncbi:hypothetical protein GCM10009733_010810 [Nonomuraea maheshkhaliensis]|uniref:SIP-like Rossmann fold domain-containing protein n=1 Tax=Nonomuraea maheshkhaliensis TaxID=419590 RepID=A0ABP4QQH8_9ACTN
MAADESGLPALPGILARLPADTRGHAPAEIPSAATGATTDPWARRAVTGGRNAAGTGRDPARGGRRPVVTDPEIVVPAR